MVLAKNGSAERGSAQRGSGRRKKAGEKRSILANRCNQIGQGFFYGLTTFIGSFRQMLNPISDPKGTRAASSTIKGDEMMAALGEVPQHTRALLSKVGVKLAPTPARPATPLTKSLPALLEYAACYAVLIRQPIGIRAVSYTHLTLPTNREV